MVNVTRLSRLIFFAALVAAAAAAGARAAEPEARPWEVQAVMVGTYGEAHRASEARTAIGMGFETRGYLGMHGLRCSVQWADLFLFGPGVTFIELGYSLRPLEHFFTPNIGVAVTIDVGPMLALVGSADSVPEHSVLGGSAGVGLQVLLGPVTLGVVAGYRAGLPVGVRAPVESAALLNLTLGGRYRG